MSQLRKYITVSDAVHILEKRELLVDCVITDSLWNFLTYMVEKVKDPEKITDILRMMKDKNPHVKINDLLKSIREGEPNFRAILKEMVALLVFIQCSGTGFERLHPDQMQLKIDFPGEEEIVRIYLSAAAKTLIGRLKAFQDQENYKFQKFFAAEIKHTLGRLTSRKDVAEYLLKPLPSSVPKPKPELEPEPEPEPLPVTGAERADKEASVSTDHAQLLPEETPMDANTKPLTVNTAAPRFKKFASLRQ